MDYISIEFLVEHKEFQYQKLKFKLLWMKVGGLTSLTMKSD